MENLTGEDIYTWCLQKEKNPKKCIAIGGNFSEFSDEEVIRTIIDKLYGVKRPKIVDKWREEIAILIETERELDPCMIPIMIMANEEIGRRWHIIWPKKKDEEASNAHISTSRDTPERENAHSNTQGNGANVDGSQFETMVDRVVTQLERWHYEGSYRRLRIFSGTVPVPLGEETYESWKEAAVQQAEEWQCPDQIKRQRVVESLRGPAMGIIQAARRSNPQATLETYFEALDYAYGTLEDVGDLTSRLHHTFQEPGEKLSTYLIRLDKLLYKIVEKGGITRDEVDRSRMKQLLRGALTTDSVAHKFRCSGTREPILTFNELLKEIKQEEVLIEMREKTVKKVKVVQPSVEINPLEDKIVKMIEEQNKKIEQFISSQSSRNSGNSSQRSNNNSSDRGIGRGNSYNNRGRGCFRCGRIGHRAFECNANTDGSSSRTPVTNYNPHQGNSTGQGNEQGRAVNPSQSP
ncbi:paraneoplastic antigen Ma1 homolog [Pseudophryne corroboree]|uniref:paraneoplastic antigen Ma1 homolog n=1 Tax=Pseudophryne corroboree TaxID=495146 RepID=UPI00308188F2